MAGIREDIGLVYGPRVAAAVEGQIRVAEEYREALDGCGRDGFSETVYKAWYADKTVKEDAYKEALRIARAGKGE
jgi:hypothetical protein